MDWQFVSIPVAALIAVYLGVGVMRFIHRSRWKHRGCTALHCQHVRGKHGLAAR